MCMPSTKKLKEGQSIVKKNLQLRSQQSNTKSYTLLYMYVYIEEQMCKDDETTATELDRILQEKKHQLSLRVPSQKTRVDLSWDS